MALLTYAALVVGVLIGCGLGAYATREHEGKDAVVTDIASLRRSPEKYAGKLVKVSGKLDECFGWECSLCPETMNSTNANGKQCLPLEFRPLVPETGFGEEEKEGIYRFSSVTIVARFNPTCFKEGVCLDRQVVLENADVVSVDRRRSSRDGLWLGGVTPLQEMSSLTAAQIKTAALQAGFPPDPAMKVFSVEGHQNTAVVCWTSFGMNSWPSSLEAAVSAMSINDYYKCNKVRKLADQWVVQAQIYGGS